ncbi:hypothetical protein Clacol_009662 [Clathrus columnatus]|uniref:Arylamine N-acetyltransferase n=1 Tax=Clathrus columnatus TaxID=1419009 RepID=A0AAV5AR79_9AGAM|nr:hypothetical protein Clacol_009662 [Clathrus columnatus]
MAPIITIAPTASLYTPAQVKAYAERIGLDLDGFTPDLQNLSPTHKLDSSPEFLYDRMVIKKQGGSLCCGMNGFFMLMLRGLGYKAINVSARQNLSPYPEPPTNFSFMGHITTIVQLGPGDALYLVDVAFGRNCPVRPIPLIIGSTVLGGTPEEEFRITRFIHPEAALQIHHSHLEPALDVTVGHWALNYRCSGLHNDWALLFIFNLVELFNVPDDWVEYTHWINARPTKLYSENVFALKFFLIDGDKDKVGRYFMIGHKTYRRVGAHYAPVKEFKTERERVNILREDFGIIVSEEEIGNISGAVALPLALV